MSASRYSVSRRRVCDQCSKAKTRCIQGAECCLRCVKKNLVCQYTSVTGSRGSRGRGTDGTYALPTTIPETMAFEDIRTASSDRSAPSENEELFGYLPCLNQSPRHHNNLGSLNTVSAQPSSASGGSYRGGAGQDNDSCFEIAESEFVCPIDADDIQNRWLSSYIPLPDQKVKEYPHHVIKFMSRVLKSYANIVINGRGSPPFIHSTQTENSKAFPQLLTCLSLVRLFARPFPGSKDVAIEIVKQELKKLYPFEKSSSSTTLLSVFQAYLLYTLVLYFAIDNLPTSFLRQNMLVIQELACASSWKGVVCLAEQQSRRPRWEAWSIVEAKRRSLFTMYMFDSILLSKENLPSHLAIELKGLPAPSSKLLWQATSRNVWERTYDLHIAEWPDRALRIDELWPLPPESNETEAHQRSLRIDRWLESVDEFGTMLFAVTSCTHGS